MAEEVTDMGRAGGVVELQHGVGPQLLVTAPLQRDEADARNQGEAPAQECRRAGANHAVFIPSRGPQHVPPLVWRIVRPHLVLPGPSRHGEVAHRGSRDVDDGGASTR